MKYKILPKYLKKISKKKDTFWIILIFAIILGVYFSEDITSWLDSKESNNMSNGDLEDTFQNINEFHWRHMPITYQRINYGGCDGVQFDKMADAFNIIQELTEGIVNFVEVEQDPDIKIVCLDRVKLREELKEVAKDIQVCKNVTFDYRKNFLKHYDEDGLDKNIHIIINTELLKISDNETIYNVCYGDVNDLDSLGSSFLKDISFDLNTLGHAQPIVSGNVITGAKIYFFKTGQGWSSCIFPAKEIHEILHIFGFGHSYEPYWDPQWGYTDWSYASDIMFPHLYCDRQKELDEKYVSCLKKIYSGIGDCLGVNFLEWDENGSLIPEGICANGWYPVEGTDYCCPEPDMEIVDGYCG